MIFDTNALLAAADEHPAILAIIARANELALPVIVLGEYRYGIAQSRNRSDYENWLRRLLPDCTVLDINEETTRYYASINLELKRLGKPVPTNDLWIAALGQQHSLPILSRDQHFDSIPGNSRISW